MAVLTAVPSPIDPIVGRTWRSRSWTRVLPVRLLWWLLDRAIGERITPTGTEPTRESLLHRILMKEVR